MKRLMDLVARMSYILMQGTLEKDISSVTYDWIVNIILKWHRLLLKI